MANLPQQVNCDVDVPMEHRHGLFANSFRVLPDGAEFLLDFLVYSNLEKSAVLVSRIRIHGGLLNAIRNRLSATLTEVAPKTQSPVVVMQGNDEIH